MEIVEFAARASVPFSLGLAAIILASVLANPEIWVGDYPPDVKAKFGPIGSRARRQRRFVAALFFGWAAAGIALTLRGAAIEFGVPGFWQTAILVFVLLEIFNLLDLLILDWLFFVKIRPGRIVLPGTEGLPGYEDYGFHFRGFLAGTAGIIVTSLIAGAIAWLIQL